MATVQHVTLVAATVSTFTLADNSSGFEILNRSGLDEIYVSADGTAAPPNPTVGGANFDVVPAAVGAAIQLRRLTQNSIVVKVISASATRMSFRSIT